MNRREFLRDMALSLAAVSGGSGLAYAAVYEPFAVEIVQQSIPVPRLGQALNHLRAVQISDLHAGGFVHRDYLAQVMRLVAAQQPDLIFMTGDYLTLGGDQYGGLRDLESILGILPARTPVYTILGNHDHGVGESALLALFQKFSFHQLENNIQPFRRGSDVLYLAGIDSVTTGNQRLDQVVRAAPADGPVILLAHEPDMADYSAPTGKFSLQLSGHSHGGQINLPILGRMVLPWMGRKYPSGLYRVGNMFQYTNRGIGMFHLPLRVNCPPEITIFTFVPA